MPIIKDLLLEGANLLSTVSDTARLDCEILLSHVLKYPRIKLISNSNEALNPEQENAFKGFLQRRANFEPVAYITGVKEFYGLEFEVTPEVLIPRPETEMIVDLALKRARELDGIIRILDLGTGSGCIPIALATELSKLGKSVLIDAVDIRPESLQVAKQNVEKHNLAGKIKLIQSNWFDSLATKHEYNIIVSNPPYVAEGDEQMSKETKFEPSAALFSGAQGLDAVRHIISKSPEYMKEGGLLLVEIGSGQGKEFQGKEFPKALIHKDISGNDRVVEISPNNSTR